MLVHGPWSDAFSNPSNSTGDGLRILTVILGIWMLFRFFQVARDVRNTRQYGMYALVCFGISAISTEIDELGEIVTPLLFLNAGGVVFGLIFLYRHVRSDPLSSYRQDEDDEEARPR